jgi:hypothetical protein
MAVRLAHRAGRRRWRRCRTDPLSFRRQPVHPAPYGCVQMDTGRCLVRQRGQPYRRLACAARRATGGQDRCAARDHHGRNRLCRRLYRHEPAGWKHLALLRAHVPAGVLRPWHHQHHMGAAHQRRLRALARTCPLYGAVVGYADRSRHAAAAQLCDGGPRLARWLGHARRNGDRRRGAGPAVCFPG